MMFCTNRRFFGLSIRSFFLQVLWNFEKMQNIGFLFIIMKDLRRIYGDDIEGYNKALRKHLEFFNIHPYMIGIVVGIVLKMEEKAYAEKKDMTKDISAIKTTMAGPLSAIGDSFFWGLWRPFVCISVSLLYFFTFLVVFNLSKDYVFRIFFLLISYLFIYNIPHFFIRCKGIQQSYFMGTDVIVYIKKWHDLNIDNKIRKLGLILSFLAVSFYCLYKQYNFFDVFRTIFVLFLILIFKNRKLTTVNLLFYIFLVLLILVYLRVI